MHLNFSLSAKEEAGTLGVNKDQEHCQRGGLKVTTKSDKPNVSDHLIQSVYHESKDVITHLIFPEEIGKGIGTMEEHPEPNSQPYTKGVVNGETKCEIGDFTKENTSLPRDSIDRPWRGVIASLLIKEEPPDGQCITKPSIYQGKTLASQNRMKPNLLYLGAGKSVLRTKPFEEGGNDEDLKSVAGPSTHDINHTSQIGASSDIGAFNEGYLCNHEEFYRETPCYRFSTQPEHAANWFHTKRINGLGDIPFTSQTIYTASELVLFKESTSLLKECAAQTHVWKPGDHSLHQRPLRELIPCTRPHWINKILHHLDLPFLEPICFKSQRLYSFSLGNHLAIFSINQKLPKAPRIFPKLSRYKPLSLWPRFFHLKPNG